MRAMPSSMTEEKKLKFGENDMNKMEISQEGLALIKKFEGCESFSLQLCSSKSNWDQVPETQCYTLVEARRKHGCQIMGEQYP